MNISSVQSTGDERPPPGLAPARRSRPGRRSRAVARLRPPRTATAPRTGRRRWSSPASLPTDRTTMELRRRSPRPAGGSTRGAWAGTWASRPTRSSSSRRASTRSAPGQAGPRRRLEPRRPLRPRACPARARPKVRAVVTLGSPFSRRPAPEQCVAALRMGRRAQGRRAADPAHHRQAAGAAALPSGRARTASSRRAPPVAWTSERDEAVELDCSHMAFGSVAHGPPSRWCTKSTAS